MKEIKLTQGKVALVDDEDYERLNRYKWYARMDGHAWYAMRSICINGKQTTIFITRYLTMKRKGKTISCECPFCKAKLRIYAYNSNACVCLKCRQPFDLSEALNLTPAKK